MKKIIKKHWYYGVFLGDLFILALFLVFSDKIFFHLDMENNLPTIYQGAKLFMVATFSAMIILLLKIAGDLDLRKKIVFGGFFLGFLFIAIDEVGQVHENIKIQMDELLPFLGGAFNQVRDAGYQSTPWIIYYIPIVILGLVLFVYTVKVLLDEKVKNLWTIFVGLAMFVGVLVMEYISTLPQFFWQDNYILLITIEEMLEKIGASFFLLFMIKTLLPYYRKVAGKFSAK